jgi:hypothetical protein
MRKQLQFATWILAAGLAWSVGYLYNVRYGSELSWLRIMYERKMAIAAEVQAPQRVIILGGSGAHYTVDAELMQQELGIPVINLGLDGPIGLNVLLPSTIEAIQPGDVVLLIPEYLILLDEDGLGDRSGAFGMAIGQPGLGDIPPRQLTHDALLLGIPTLRAVTKSTWDVVQYGEMRGYYSDPVSDNGDPTALKQRTNSSWWQMQIKDTVSDHALEQISQFRQQVESKDATLVLGLPWLYASRDAETLENVQETAAALAEIAPVLYDPDSFNLQTDSSLFADTHYHLNQDARNLRSRELVQQLEPVLDKIAESQTANP